MTLHLQNLQHVGWRLHMEGCNALKNVELPALQSVGGELLFSQNKILSSLSGMQSLTSVGARGLGF